ncbi:MAG TPA: PadR family transcriptional regulator [Firmicutes bacterium]|jgi:DNA-binding PadR family transcriptional regulator|nr:PadR family transcriptional regulator [Bacillota bacterium]
MSAIDLVILGNLQNGPQSAYEMKKELESQNIRNWVKIGIPTVYQNMIKLHRNGFLDAKAVKEGEMPEKTVYTINQKGIFRFQELMEKYSTEINSIYFDFCSFVANLDHVDKAEGLEMIANLQQQFHHKKVLLEQEVQKKNNLPVHTLSLIQLYRGLFTYLDDWSGELRKNYQEEKQQS